MTQNANKKSTLAKLLATENIEVQENQVKTASFDVKDRILTLPIFKEEHKSKYVYDMLVGHEVSHALHTPHEDWAKCADRSDEFRSFVNVLEDVRIDQLIQKKYPGLKKDYLYGFKKMFKDNFFGTKGKDLSNYALIDKINLYSKSSKTLDFKFTDKEKILVKAAYNTKSFKDVLKLAEEILGYCKKELEKKDGLKKVYINAPKKDEDSDDDKSESESSNTDIKDEKDSDDKVKEWLDKKDAEENGSAQKDNKDKKDSELKRTGQYGNGAGGDFKIVSKTNEAYEDAVKQIQDNDASSRSYGILPEVRLNKILVPYKQVIKDYLKQDSKLDPFEKGELQKQKNETQKFLKDSSNVVNYLVKEFEMKKNAKLHARSTIAKTGIIDPLKLHTYKFAEDIFKKMSNIPNQKNHGMIFLLDWSGSMQKNILATTEQLINLTMFCRKINIPFSVYAFMNPHRNDKKDVGPQTPFILSDKSLQADQSTRLVQWFSHKQSKVDFQRCAEILHRSATYFSGYYDWRNPDRIQVPSVPGDYYLSSTPLNESLIAMDKIIAKFKTDYNTQKVALVTLTDGSANSLGCKTYGNLMIKLGSKYHKCGYSYFSNDEKNLTHHLLKWLQKKYDLQTIGFYLINKFRDLQYIYHVPYRKQDLAKKMLTKQKFIADYNSAYDVYFYVKADTKVSNKTMDDSITDSTSKRILKKAFMSGMKKRLTSRVLLTNFIKRIA